MKCLNTILCLFVITSWTSALAHSAEEKGAFVRTELLRIVEKAPSDNDNDGDPFDGYQDIEPEVWRNFFGPQIYRGWGSDERTEAFEWYLNEVCTNVARRVTGEELAMFRVALEHCKDVSYTNAVPSLKRLVLNPLGVEKNVAIQVLVDCSSPSDALTDFIENIMTNKAAYRREERGAACRSYAAKLRVSEVQNSEQNRIRRRATMMFYRNRMVDAAGAYDMDNLFQNLYPGYAYSSNRVEYINFVLTHPLMRTSAYFTSVTNQLLSSGQPLRWVTIGGEGDE